MSEASVVERTKGPVELADEAALAAADWLNGPEYGGAKAQLLALARKIDGWDAVVEAAVEWAEEKSGRRPRVPMHDSTSHGTHARMLDSLGLTATSRAKLEASGTYMQRTTKTEDEKKTTDGGDGGGTDHGANEPVGEQPVGKLAQVTALRAGVLPSG